MRLLSASLANRLVYTSIVLYHIYVLYSFLVTKYKLEKLYDAQRTRRRINRDHQANKSASVETALATAETGTVIV